MLWLFLALCSHAGNAIVFVVDKSLLGTQSFFGRPVVYAFYSALLAGVAAPLLVFSYAPPSVFVVGWSLVAGGAHIVALVLFFFALKQGEPSRVVPLAGSAVPLFTLLFASFFLRETFTERQLLAVLVLIIGGGLLSLRVRSFSSQLVGSSSFFAVVSGAFFALHFGVMKFVYALGGLFLPVFVYSRIVEALLAVMVLSPFVFAARARFRTTLRPAARRRGLVVSSVFVGNKALASGAFLLQHYAISLGSVTVVNALQGVQYVFLLLLAVLVSRWLPHFFREEMRRVTLAQKLLGIGAISFGLLLLL